jgi:hypothetical protein
MNRTSDQKLKFLSKLEAVERLLTRLCRQLMLLVMASVLAGSAWVLTGRRLGPGNQGEYFYFCVAALFVLGWAVDSFVKAGRRLHRRSMPKVTVETEAVKGGRAWQFRLGSLDDEHAKANPVRAEFSRNFSIPLASITSDFLPNEETLACLEAELARGIDLDAACRTIQPAYEDWGMFQRRAYHTYVKNVLAERQRG